MGIIGLIFMGTGLAMDAFAVSICKGLKMKTMNKKNIFLISLFFGGFQALMPLIGWCLGIQFKSLIENFDHWIAFVLLVLIGGKMAMESFSKEEEDDKQEKTDDLDIRELLLLAVATSIDALAAGITLACLVVNVAFAIGYTGFITCLLSAIGVFIGHKFGVKYKNKAELLGGIILLIIAIKILLEHLGIFVL